MSRIHVPRRTLLKGLGVAMSLPFLESVAWASPEPMWSNLRDGPGKQRRPVRLAFFHVPYGIGRVRGHSTSNGEAWFWPDNKADFSPTGKLSRTLEPLRQMIQECLLIDGLEGAAGRGPGHAFETGRWLTALHPNSDEDKKSTVNIGISADQYAAQQIGMYTALPSLELGVSRCRLSGTTEGGYSRAYNNTVSYRSPTQALPSENNPRAVFNRLFSNRRGSGQSSGGPSVDVSQYMTSGGNDLTGLPQGPASVDQSMLDLVLGSSKDLKRKVSKADQRTIDEYMDSVRSLERRVIAIEQQHAAAARAAVEGKKRNKKTSKRGNFSKPIEVEISDGEMSWTEHLEVMQDLMILAFQVDITRVVTLPFSLPYDGRNYPELGFKDSHHAVTHGPSSEESEAQHIAIDALNIKMFNRIVQKMKSLNDGRGTLLDNSILMYGSGMMDTSHNYRKRLPTILAGRGGGTIKTGRVMDANGQNLGDLLGGILVRSGCKLEKPFATGTKLMDGLS